MKSDVSIAKNYLNEAHIEELNRIVSVYLDLAENNAKRSQLMYMKEWSKFLTNFLQLSNYPILKDKGKVSILEAKLKAEGEFEKYRLIQDKEYKSDFDKIIKKMDAQKKKKVSNNRMIKNVFIFICCIACLFSLEKPLPWAVVMSIGLCLNFLYCIIKFAL